MTHPVLHLEALNILTHPRRANIFEMIADEKKITFKILLEKTGMSKDGLSKHLKQLFYNYLIKVSINKKNESYVQYTLTEKGQYFHNILHNVFIELATIPQRYISGLFVIDANTFWKLKEKGISKITKMFRGSKIVFTNSDFSTILEKNEEDADIVLEELLYSDKQVIVPTVYKDTVNGIMHEFYLRRSKKLSKQDAHVVAMAMDLNASLISDNPKILQAAKSLGILCTDLKTISEIDESQPLAEQFYELTNKNYDPSSIEFLIEKSYPEIIKKN